MEHTPNPICLGSTESHKYPGSSRFEVPIHVGDPAIPSSRGNCVCIVYLGGNGGIDGTKEAVEAFAAHIVRAVNAFEPLKTALERIRPIVEIEIERGGGMFADNDLSVIRAALALATKE
jgi:hypothetical protein